MLKVLTFSTLYPNGEQPSHGIFVETRLRHLLKSGRIDARVVAPVPWFPSTHPRFGHYATFARVARDEQRHGIRVTHPRYPLIPKIGETTAPLLLARAMRPVVEQIVDEGFDFDVIDAHYFYPDGVAAAIIGRALKKPVVITARGTDLTLIPRHRLPRSMIRWAAGRAAGLITVCQALKDALVDLGIPASRVDVMRNGVDLDLFRPVDRARAREKLGLTGPTLLSVGLLIARKAHDIAIRSLRLLPDHRLLIAGIGPEEANLKTLAEQCGVSDRVRFLGALSQPHLREHYGAVDALVLASSREGWANVLLESMACDTPVIASDVGGTAEVVAAREAGVLMRERTPAALADAARQLFSNYPAAGATRRYAEGFSWDETSDAQVALFERIVAARQHGSTIARSVNATADETPHHRARA
jgi:teichuronic acid biosynthesis glycosyltransferase TuaC